jgi:hypothetical protein
MKTKSKFAKLRDKEEFLSSGFGVLGSDQLLKLKGGFHIPRTNTNIFNCGNCGCINIMC